MPNKRATPVFRGFGRVAFLARRGAIQQRVTEGWPLKAIYNDYADTLGITYSQFCRYVSRFITPLAPAVRSRTALAAPAASTGAADVQPTDPPSPDAGEDTHVGRAERPDGTPGGRRFTPHDKIQRPGDFERLTGCKPPR